MACKCNGYGMNPDFLAALGYYFPAKLDMPKYCNECPLGAFRSFYDNNVLGRNWRGSFKDWLQTYVPVPHFAQENILDYD